jgi:protein ImuB
MRMSTGSDHKLMACIYAPALPLQILLQRQAQWRNEPAVVVDQDDAQGIVQWVNKPARQSGILPGMRIASALSLLPKLHCGCVDDSEIANISKKIHGILEAFSPLVERASWAHAFWLGLDGMQLLFPSLPQWAEQIRERLLQQDIYCRISVGFSRFGTYASSCQGSSITVHADPQAERGYCQKISLARLDINPRERQALAKLGVHSLADLLNLPAGALRLRFGSELQQLHQQASGEHNPPLQNTPLPQPRQSHIYLDEPDSNGERLLFYFKRLLETQLQQLADDAQALHSMRLTFVLERQLGHVVEEVRPATPTLDAKQLLDLLRLKLEALPLQAGACELQLLVQGVLVSREQLRLFANKPKRDLAAGNRALARIRAEFGESAVVYACRREAHLPEAQQGWEPCHELRPAKPRPAAIPQLIRRIYNKPIPMPPRLRLSPEGWLLNELNSGAVLRLLGPHVISGGWWAREVQRDYYYAEMQRGRILWIYHDRQRRRWFIQGEVM